MTARSTTVLVCVAACASSAAGGTYVPNKPSDVDLLPNGNILVTDSGDLGIPGTSGVYEIDRDGNIVWSFAPSTGPGVLNWAHNADRLPSGDTIISDTENDRVLIIDSTGTILWDTDTITFSDGSTLHYPNDANLLSNGHALITVRDDNRAIEVRLDGTIEWSYEAGAAGAVTCSDAGLRGPHNADRLSNGNTIVADSLHDRVIEVDASGSIVWCYGSGLNWPRDADRLPGGNTLINDSDNYRVIEVTPGGSIVWSYAVASRSYDADRLPSGNTLISLSGSIIEVNPCGTIVWEYPASTTPHVLWTTGLEGVTFACPVVAPDGYLYLATHSYGGVLYKINPCDGSIVDSEYTPGTVENAAMMDGSGRLFLVTLVGRLAAGNPYPASRRAMAILASDFSALWSTSLLSGSDNSPILGDERVYVGVVVDPRNPVTTTRNCGSPPVYGEKVVSCRDGFPCSGCCGKFYGFEAATGDVRINMSLEGWQATPGVVDEGGRVFFGIEDLTGGVPAACPPNSEVWPGKFYGIDGSDPVEPNDPTVLWSFDTPGGDFGSPTGYADGVIYSTCRDGYLRGFDPDSGAEVLKRWLGARSWSGVTIGRNGSGNAVLYTGTQSVEDLDPNDGIAPGQFWAIEVDGTFEGNELWHTQINGMSFGNAALDDAGYLYVTNTHGWLYALKANDGTVAWMYDLPGSTGGDDGPTILEDGTVVATSNDPPDPNTGAAVGYITAIRGFGGHLDYDAPWPKYKHDLRNTSNVLTPIHDLPGDVTGDGCIDLVDLSLLLSNYGTSGSYWDGDLDGDGAIGLPDLAQLLARYGTCL